MKKIFILLIVVISLLLFSLDDYNITKDAIRFRIIPNSNSVNDILIKEKVVKRISDIVFIDSNNPDIVRDNIISSIEKVSVEIDKIFKEENYNETYNIIYGINDFPEKEYNGIVYPEGKYESLVIEIGDAKGDNFWCFLYPSLCLIDVNDNKNEYNSRILSALKDIF